MADDLAVVDQTDAAPVTPAPVTAPVTPAATDAAPAAAAPPPVTSTLLDGEPGPEGKSAPASQWPENWRQELAGGDEKELKRLERMKSPSDVFKMARELERKMSSGEYLRKLPENATPEQVAAFRKEQGIPEEPGKYEMPKLDNYEWTDTDKEIVGDLFAEMHAANLPQSAAEIPLKWYGKFVERQQEHFRTINKQAQDKVEDTLRTELGADYRPTVQLLQRMFKDNSALPEPVAAAVRTATLPDGRLLFNEPSVVSYFVGLAREKYGDGAILTGEQESSLSSREDEIVKIMNTDSQRYWNEKNAKGQSMADELIELRQRRAKSR